MLHVEPAPRRPEPVKLENVPSGTVIATLPVGPISTMLELTWERTKTLDKRLHDCFAQIDKLTNDITRLTNRIRAIEPKKPKLKSEVEESSADDMLLSKDDVDLFKESDSTTEEDK